MKFRGDFEITGGIIRLVRADLPVGSPFEVVVTIIGDEGTATIKGLRADGFTAAHRDAVFDALRAAGFTRRRWVRHLPGGGVRVVEGGL